MKIVQNCLLNEWILEGKISYQFVIDETKSLAWISFQVRKVYEPHLFINASFLPIFDKYFGDINSRQLSGAHSICAVGFEPNPKHTKWLKDLQLAYEKCGWKAKFHTKTAAAHSYGLATFYSDGEEKNFEWGASIVKSKKAVKPIGVAR